LGNNIEKPQSLISAVPGSEFAYTFHASISMAKAAILIAMPV